MATKPSRLKCRCAVRYTASAGHTAMAAPSVTPRASHDRLAFRNARTYQSISEILPQEPAESGEEGQGGPEREGGERRRHAHAAAEEPLEYRPGVAHEGRRVEGEQQQHAGQVHRIQQ